MSNMETARTLSALAYTLMVLILMKPVSLSKPADAKKTRKSCLFCHTSYDSKELTRPGKYYKEKGNPRWL